MGSEVKIKQLSLFKKEDQFLNRNHILIPHTEYEVFRKEEIFQSVSARFETQVERNSKRLAVKTSLISYTYEEINIMANKIGHSLQGLNVFGCTISSLQVAALLFGHDARAVIGLLGVLKSGLTYVPLDTSYPKERLKLIMEDSGARVIVTDEEHFLLAEMLRSGVDGSIKIINIDRIGSEVSGANLELTIQPERAAYILYTSGSTGTPKGVIQSHKNILHFARVYANALYINPCDRLSLLSTYCFDAAKMDIYGALLNGAALFPFDLKKENGITGLPEWMKSEGITIYHSTPTVFRYLMDNLSEKEDFSNIRLVVLGGEAVFKKDVGNYKKYFSDSCVFVNGLGPTESTVSLQYFINKSTEISKEIVPVGYPVEETQVYILDNNGKELHYYGIGEIVLKSDYLALGYLNNESKTKEVFITDPVTNEGRVYKTGDLGRRLTDGTIEFCGRKDEQVKVRGYRIELGEIEGKLDSIEGISKSVILCLENENKENYLVALYKKEKEIKENMLLERLRQSLPDYMIPQIFYCIEEFPLTSTGKIDRRKLSAEYAVKDFNQIRYVPSSNETEQKLVKIWQDILKVDRIGINDNFFVQGGHSLKATILVSFIYKVFEVEMSLIDIFENPTIKEIAEKINTSIKVEYKSIPKAKNKDYYELSSIQKRIYVLQQLDKDSSAYSLFRVVFLEGELNIDNIEDTFRELINRHESLRTSFDYRENGPVQIIHEKVDFAIEYFEGRENEIDKIIKKFKRNFDLAKAPLMRVGVIKLNNTRYVLMRDSHHIIFDGISQRIFYSEFLQLLNGQKLLPVKLQYKDYSEWHNFKKKAGLLKREEDFWLDQFKGELPVLNLPSDFQRPAIQSSEGKFISFELSSDLSSRLKEFAIINESSLFMVLLSVFSVVLSKISGQEDIIIGTITAGRRHADLNKIIGVFLNTLALRTFPSGNKKYKNFLDEIRNNTINCFENQDYQFEDLIEKLNIERDPSRTPLFTVMMVLQNFEKDIFSYRANLDEINDNLGTKKENRSSLLNLKYYDHKLNKSANDITLYINDKNEIISFSFNYCTKLFKEETIARIFKNFETALISILNNAETEIHNIDIITETEREKILLGFNNTFSETDNLFIHEIIEQQSLNSSSKIALTENEKRITYKELNNASNNLALFLRDLGIQRNDFVGIMMDRSINAIVAILAVLKAGAAYVPIDPHYPVDRKRYICKNSNIKLLLTLKEFEKEDPELITEYSGIIIYTDATDLPDKNIGNVDVINDPEDIAYAIYTSGTTGDPKGVLIRHKSLTNYVQTFIKYYGIAKGDSFIHQASLSFDISIEEIFPPLCSSASIVIIKEGGINIEKIIKTIEGGKANVLSATPLLLGELNNHAERLRNLRFIISGGDSLQSTQIDKLIKYIPVYNTYGPTEATVCATYNRISDTRQASNIGRPISNAKIYILDKHLHIQPIGIPGEIYIGGAGIAKGYLHDEELTKTKFIQSPFTSDEIIYRSGDFGKWCSDGAIEFIGRKDNQVKIRGYRIELKEIEKQISSFEGINEAVVIAANEIADKALIAFYTEKEDISTLRLRRHLRDFIPDYMIPSAFIKVVSFPLLPNGKINVKELEKIASLNVLNDDDYVPPKNEFEIKLAAIWEESLNVKKVGLNHNFFRLGGNSLLLIKVISRLDLEFGVAPDFVDFFNQTFGQFVNNYKRKIEALMTRVEHL